MEEGVKTPWAREDIKANSNWVDMGITVLCMIVSMMTVRETEVESGLPSVWECLRAS